MIPSGGGGVDVLCARARVWCLSYKYVLFCFYLKTHGEVMFLLVRERECVYVRGGRGGGGNGEGGGGGAARDAIRNRGVLKIKVYTDVTRFIYLFYIIIIILGVFGAGAHFERQPIKRWTFSLLVHPSSFLIIRSQIYFSFLQPITALYHVGHSRVADSEFIKRPQAY